MSQEKSREAQLQLVRHSLILGVFEPYYQLSDLLKKLPINQNAPLLQKAYLDIDTGMALIKEAINSSIIELEKPKPEETIVCQHSGIEFTPEGEVVGVNP